MHAQHSIGDFILKCVWYNYIFIRLQLARSPDQECFSFCLREWPGVLWRLSCSIMDALESELALVMGNSLTECYLVHTTCKYKIIWILCVRCPEEKTTENKKKTKQKEKRKTIVLSHPSESLSLASDGLPESRLESVAIGEWGLGVLGPWKWDEWHPVDEGNCAG